MLDFAFCEQSTSLASREHFIAGCVGWAADWPDVSKNEFANGVLEAAGGPDPEHHFHVFDDVIAEQLVSAALWLHGSGTIAVRASPYSKPTTEGEIVLVTRMSGEPQPVRAIEQARSELSSALARLAKE